MSSYSPQAMARATSLKKAELILFEREARHEVQTD